MRRSLHRLTPLFVASLIAVGSSAGCSFIEGWGDLHFTDQDGAARDGGDRDGSTRDAGDHDAGDHDAGPDANVDTGVPPHDAGNDTLAPDTGVDAARDGGFVCAPAVAAGTAPSIDDFEDGDRELITHEGRDGFWSTFSDGTGTVTPTMPDPVTPSPANGSTHALHVMGSGHTSYGWGLIVDLDHAVSAPPTPDGRCAYDASVYQGIRFRVRGSGTARFALSTPTLLPPDQGGTCDAATEGQCNNFHGASVTLGAEWRTVELRWAELTQDASLTGYKHAALDLTHAESILFTFGTATADFWLDDVTFIDRSTGSCLPLGAAGSNPVIDAFEAVDRQLSPFEGRFGFWGTYDDGTGTTTPTSSLTSMMPVPSNGTVGALNAVGTGHTAFGWGLTVDLNHPNSAPRCTYDAAAYTGITFRAHGVGVMRATLMTNALVPTTQGGPCNDVPAGRCGNYHFAPITLTTSWTTYRVHWADVAQDAGWYYASYQTAPLDPTALVSVGFSFPSGDTSLWLDDLSFTTD